MKGGFAMVQSAVEKSEGVVRDASLGEPSWAIGARRRSWSSLGPPSRYPQLLSPTITILPAVLGGGVVVVTGLRRVYNWQENWARFSGVCALLETEGAKFKYGREPYNNTDARENEGLACHEGCARSRRLIP